MNKYILQSNNYNGSILLEFNDKGLLKSITNETDLSDHNAIYKRLIRIPCEERYLDELKKIGVSVRKAPLDLSFERFWDTYANKLGKKSRAEKLWAVMSETQKIQCLQSIPLYDQWLSTRNIEKAYPETYLAQRRWENSYSGTPVLFK